MLYTLKMKWSSGAVLCDTIFILLLYKVQSMIITQAGQICC